MLLARIKELPYFSGLWIKRGDIGPFVAITPETGVRKVAEFCSTYMFFRQDMIDFMTIRIELAIVRFSTIFTLPLGVIVYCPTRSGGKFSGHYEAVFISLKD